MCRVCSCHPTRINAEDAINHMKTTHLLVVRFKSSNRLHLKAEFQTKIAAEAAAIAILSSNFDRFICEISAK